MDTTQSGRIIVQKPPTAQNYAIGNSGPVTGQGSFPAEPGFIEGTDEARSLWPSSLYEEQLAERQR